MERAGETLPQPIIIIINGMGAGHVIERMRRKRQQRGKRGQIEGSSGRYWLYIKRPPAVLGTLFYR